jgi:poly(3-hydroxybutyrate) depolymerase
VKALTSDKTRTVMNVALALAFLLTAAGTASATLTGTFIDGTMTWGGITRYYRIYVPVNLPPNPALVMMLHGTSTNPASAPPTTKNFDWWTLADKYHFIEVQPASTYNTKSGQCNWNAYYLDSAFQTSPGPDDSGFLRQLIIDLSAQYALNPKQIYVAGFSSGGEMAQRVGVDISDLVAAIIAVSGQISAVTALPIVLPGPPVDPVSVQEWHGTLDTVLPPCNNGSTRYSGHTFHLATVDQSFNYWTQQNACMQFATNQPLCVSGAPNPSVTSNDATGCANNTEVQFIWEVGTTHAWNWNASTGIVRWNFFASHPKP